MCFAAGEWQELDWSRVGTAGFFGPWWGEEGSWLCVPVWAGAHLEGPFISKEKKGAHPEHCLRTFEAGAFQDLLATYGSLDCVRIVTLAPEMKRSSEVIQELTKRGICVSLGKGWGGGGLGKLCFPLPRGPGSPSFGAVASPMVSQCDWTGWDFLLPGLYGGDRPVTNGDLT